MASSSETVLDAYQPSPTPDIYKGVERGQKTRENETGRKNKNQKFFIIDSLLPIAKDTFGYLSVVESTYPILIAHFTMGQKKL